MIWADSGLGRRASLRIRANFDMQVARVANEASCDRRLPHGGQASDRDGQRAVSHHARQRQ